MPGPTRGDAEYEHGRRNAAAHSGPRLSHEFAHVRSSCTGFCWALLSAKVGAEGKSVGQGEMKKDPEREVRGAATLLGADGAGTAAD